MLNVGYHSNTDAAFECKITPCRSVTNVTLVAPCAESNSTVIVDHRYSTSGFTFTDLFTAYMMLEWMCGIPLQVLSRKMWFTMTGLGSINVLSPEPKSDPLCTFIFLTVTYGHILYISMVRLKTITAFHLRQLLNTITLCKQ